MKLLGDSARRFYAPGQALPTDLSTQDRDVLLPKDGNADGEGSEVYDHLWRIVWRQDPEPERMTWSAALDYAWQQSEGSNLWRLPTVEELSTLIDTDVAGEVQKAAWLGDDSNWYWSATPDADGSRFAWCVVFFDGYVLRLRHDVGRRVRLVRGVARSVS